MFLNGPLATSRQVSLTQLTELLGFPGSLSSPEGLISSQSHARRRKAEGGKFA